ncbi:MAG: M28 family peptidase [Terriglobia bacterium]
MKSRVVILVSLILCLGPTSITAQDTPVVPAKVWQALANELSGDIAFDHLRQLTLYHSPNGGSEGFRWEAEWVAAKAREVGLEEVRIYWMKSPTRGWTLRAGEAWIAAPEEQKLGDVRETPLRVAVNSRTTDVTAELIDVGRGTQEADYEGKDVKGKIVLASGTPGAVQAQAVWKQGALGIISDAARRPSRLDQMPYRSIPARSRDGKHESAFAWILTPREGQRLRARLAAAGRAKPNEKPQPVRVQVKIEAEFGEQIQGLVEGWIRGSEIHDQAVVLTAHLQEEKTSANDDRSGCANLLEIGRTLVRLIQEGKLARPRRDIRFWWANEIRAEYQYFAEHPDEAGRILANLNQDMVGARQSAGERVQFMSRTTFSRPSFLNDVVESVLEAVRLGNTAFPLRAGVDEGNYSRPLLSTLGTQEPYRAEAVPFYDATDHLVFNDGRVGIPGISLTNWPDPYIHSSDDDLWQMDATQLKRNAFIVAASAYFIALTGEAELPRLAMLLLSSARKRLVRDSASALALLHDESDRTMAGRYADALLLLEEATRHELATVDSARALAAPGGAGESLLATVRQRIEQLAALLRADLDTFYRQTTGAEPRVELSAKEKTASQQIPEWTGPLAETLAKLRTQASVRGIHNFYAFEVRNLIDGHRSILDIYRTVRAAALSAGEWYYGPVELAKVKEVLQSAVKAGAVRLKLR